MKVSPKTLFCLLILLMNTGKALVAQKQRADTLPPFKTIAAGKEYKRSSFHEFLWGKNYRKEWATPVKTKVFLLDTAMGGLKPDKAGGGHQSKSLHVKTKGDQEYTLRSVNKTLGKVLPKDFQHTFVEDLANDLVSMSNPYSALGVPYMTEKAGILHTEPQYVFVPHQPGLDSFNDQFGNSLYLLEQRASGDWNHSPNMGNFASYIGTDKVLDNILKNNHARVDAYAFAKARLFDMLIGDWDRHEDQWKWGTVEKNQSITYVPVPSDRDQAFSKHGGVLLGAAMGASGIKYMQSFKKKLDDVPAFNFEQRGIDRIFTNALTLNDWQAAATSLQQSITDAVIETSIKQMPPEVYGISGKEIITALKSRRDHLQEYAKGYYLFLAKEVEIVGSKGSEYFSINRLNNNEISVSLSEKNKAPFYTRTFNAGQTKEIRLFGLAGEDVYTIEGKGDPKITVRIIGGNDKDSIIDRSGTEKVHIYDDYKNVIVSAKHEKLHRANDSTIHEYRYKSFEYDRKGLSPLAFYDNPDRLYVGLGYQFTHHKWRKEPFAFMQKIEGHYSLSQKAFSVWYNGLFPDAVGKNDLVIRAYYDAVNWRFYYGLGNETKRTVSDVDFNRLRTAESYASIGLHRGWAKNNLTLSAFYQSTDVLRDEARLVAKTVALTDPNLYNAKYFGGALLSYDIHWLKDSLLPEKGIIFSSGIRYTQNLQQSSRSVAKYEGTLQLFIPLVPKISLAIKTGASTISGTPEFYQNVFLGGPENLRGYRLDRFWGRTAFYNSNELRFITNLRSYLYNGKVGVFAFYDQGRVWIPSQKSNTWHTAYGPGLLVAPFNKIAGVVTYGITPELNLILLKVIKYF